MRLLISILFTTIFSLPALAGEFYVLEMDDVHMKSGQGNDTIKIRRKLRQQHGVVSQDYDLLSVMMVAKTRKGQGKAQLLVGQNSSTKQKFGGTPATFKSNGDSSFDRHLFLNPKDNSNGPWQMKLQGNFIVRQLVVEIGHLDQEFLLDYSHDHMKSGEGNDTIALRRDAKNQHGINTQDYEILGITLVAKTRKGQGKAQLRIGGELSAKQKVDGSPGQFHNNADWTYSTYEFDNPKEDSNGPWQVKLQGNFKIKEVILHVTKK